MNIGGLLLGIFIAAFLYAFLRPREPDKNAEEEKAGYDLAATIESTPAVEEPVHDPEKKPALKPALKSDNKVEISDDAPADKADDDDVATDNKFQGLRGSRGLGGKTVTLAEGSEETNGTWGAISSFFQRFQR